MIRQMGPIAYQLQPGIMVLTDRTGEPGLVRISAVVRERSDKLAVLVLLAAHQVCTAV